MSYASRIETVPIKNTEFRWPKPPMYCVWDCGNYWEGYDAPVHIGLDNETRDAFVTRLQAWKTECIKHAGENAYILKRSNTSSIEAAIRAAHKSGYVQEVCGQYIDETDKWLRDNRRGLPWILEQLGAFKGTSDGINEYVQSLLTDETARHVTTRDYRCQLLNVRSTGNPIVDRVRTALSFNDIQVTRSKELMAKQDAVNLDNLRRFNDKLYRLITEEVTDIYQRNSTVFNDRCINAKRRAGQTPRSKKIDATFFHNRDDGSRCLILATVQGNLDCKFWMRDGLAADVAAVSSLSGQSIRSAVRKKAAGWVVQSSEMPDARQAHTTVYSEVNFLFLFFFCEKKIT